MSDNNNSEHEVPVIPFQPPIPVFGYEMGLTEMPVGESFIVGAAIRAFNHQGKSPTYVLPLVEHDMVLLFIQQLRDYANAIEQQFYGESPKKSGLIIPGQDL